MSADAPQPPITFNCARCGAVVEDADSAEVQAAALAALAEARQIYPDLPVGLLCDYCGILEAVLEAISDHELN